jgi:uncharacterized protein (DUF1800 family)
MFDKRDPSWAWAPFVPDARRPWNLALAGHLYRRAGFGANWAELQQALADGPQRSIDKLLRPEADVPAFNRSMDEFEIGAIDPDTSSADALRQWWLRRMIETPHPLLEKMTLFWHHHFATSNAHAQDGRAMQAYVATLRKHALGRVPALVGAMVRDPATLASVELGFNPKSQPSDRLARPLLESFTLGPGQFSAQDVRETARALTGWTVRRRRAYYLQEQHDSGVKTVLDRSGRFGGAEVVEILVGQPATAAHLVRKLYRWLISELEPPEEALVRPLAERFGNGYDIAGLVGLMLRSNLFFSPAAYRRRIASPVEFALGVVRPFGAMVPTAALGGHLAACGEDLCQPPTVHGWAGGRAWITTATLAGRCSLASALVSSEEPYNGKLDPAALARQNGAAGPRRAAEWLLDLLLQGDLDAPLRRRLLEPMAHVPPADAPQALRRFIHTILLLPEFQLN